MKFSIRNFSKFNLTKTQKRSFLTNTNFTNSFNTLRSSNSQRQIQSFNFNFQQNKKFSTSIDKEDMAVLEQYKSLIDKSNEIFEDIFAKKFSKRQEIMKYFNFDVIFKNLKIDDSIPLESMNHSILDPC